MVTLFYNDGILETTPEIANSFNLEEFDEIPNLSTLLAIVSKTETYQTNKMYKDLQEQP